MMIVCAFDVYRLCHFFYMGTFDVAIAPPRVVSYYVSQTCVYYVIDRMRCLDH